MKSANLYHSTEATTLVLFACINQMLAGIFKRICLDSLTPNNEHKSSLFLINKSNCIRKWRGIMVSCWTSVCLSVRPSASRTSVRPFVFRFRMMVNMMPRPPLIVSQSECLIKVVDTKSHTKWQTVQIQLS